MGKLDNYLLVTDMDGTLYEDQNHIPKENVRAIAKFRELGGKFTVATGRGIVTAEFIKDELDLDLPVIVNNGHTFYDYDKGEIVYEVNLPDSAKTFARSILDKFPGVGCQVFSGRELYAVRVNQTLLDQISYEEVEFKEASIEQVLDIPWQKVLFEDEFEKIEEVRAFAAENIPCDVAVVDTYTLFMELCTTDTNKGTALLRLADMLNIPHSNTFGVGNYYNDEELVAMAGVGAFVADSPRDLCDIADFVTKKTAEEGAIAEFIEYILENQK